MTTVVCYVFVSALAAALGAQEHMRTSWLLLLLQAVPALCWVAPAYAPMRTSRSRAYVSMAALRPGDKVVVIGVTGGVGQLTVARLANEGKYKVRAVGRSAERSKQVLGLDNIEYASADTKEVRRHDRLGTNVQTGIHADLVEMCCQLDSLYKPLDDADAVIIATGTSALPSPRWKVRCPTRYFVRLSIFHNLKHKCWRSRALAICLLNSNVAYSQGGNTPDAVDRRGVKNILAALSSRPRKKQVQLVDPMSFTTAHSGAIHASPRITGGRVLRASCDRTLDPSASRGILLWLGSYS